MNCPHCKKKIDNKQKYVVMFLIDGEAVAEIYEGRAGLTKAQVIDKVIAQCKKEGVTYYGGEVEIVIEV